MKRNKKGFTLIELVAVLVILAILALIVTPLVMNIVKKAKDSANKRSVDAYGKSVELAVATYLLDTGDYPDSLDNLTVEYSGNEVVCNTQILNEDGSIYLSKCSVSGVEVKDSKTEDGYYHYGNSQVGGNTDSKTTYNVGDVVTYNGMNFYVIENSDEKDDTVTLLKETPLTVDEVNTYGAGHVNMYVDPTSSFYQTAYDMNGYGAMAYYSTATCGYEGVDGCTTDYSLSDVKYVIDAWATDKTNASDLKEDKTGYSVRLITFEELTTNLGYVKEDELEYMNYDSNKTPSFIYDSDYSYLTMSPYEYYTFRIWGVNDSGMANYSIVGYGDSGVVRPVITILKTSL